MGLVIRIGPGQDLLDGQIRPVMAIAFAPLVGKQQSQRLFARQTAYTLTEGRVHRGPVFTRSIDDVPAVQTRPAPRPGVVGVTPAQD